MFQAADLTAAVVRKAPLDEWERALPRIESERRRVVEYIRKGGQAYGFTTLFGHLDSIGATQAESLSLFEAHLVGTPEPIGEFAARGIATIKLCQLSLGGSGISTETYQHLLFAFGQNLAHTEVNLRGSYGSGDVVPGAWFVRAIFGQSPEFQSGDLMALINGSYIPAGVILGHQSEIERIFHQSYRAVEESARLATKNQTHAVQLPVSLRDVTQLSAHIRYVLSLIHI